MSDNRFGSSAFWHSVFVLALVGAFAGMAACIAVIVWLYHHVVIR